MVAGGACIVEGGCAWLPGVCMVVGACMVVGGHVWLMGVRGCRGHAWLWGCVWLPGGMHGCEGACIGYNEIWSMSGHPTGMHSCSLCIFKFLLRVVIYFLIMLLRRFVETFINLDGPY